MEKLSKSEQFWDKTSSSESFLPFPAKFYSAIEPSGP